MTSEVRAAAATTGLPDRVDDPPTKRGTGGPSAPRPQAPREDARPERVGGVGEVGRVVSVPGSGLTIEVAPHRCFACGALNEHGIHLDLHVDGDRCWTELELPERFQGWDGIAHGGIICTILDEVMAWSLAATDNWGLTARMSVEFKRPVRLGTPIRGEGTVTSIRRRIVETAGRIVDQASGEVLATATAIYVAADAARKAELQARYGFRLTPSGIDGPTPNLATEPVADGTGR